MKIQSINQQSVSTKALFFTKTTPLCNKCLNYVNKSEQKITDKGIKYLEDTKINTKLKNKISENPLVKLMSESYDTFITYSEFKAPKIYDNKKEFYYSVMEMNIVDTIKRAVHTFNFVGSNENSLENAQNDCLKKMNVKVQEFIKKD